MCLNSASPRPVLAKQACLGGALLLYATVTGTPSGSGTLLPRSELVWASWNSVNWGKGSGGRMHGQGCAGAGLGVAAA